MTTDELKAAVLTALTDVAPEADAASVRFDLDLRDQVDMDSMDSLNFLIAVHQQLSVDIPEADWAHLHTLGELVDYLAERVGG